MELLKQCQKWFEEDKHKMIIEALEAIPDDKRTTAIDMELARAYNNEAVLGEESGRKMLKQAVNLLKKHESEMKDDYSWNFRMAYAHYYLDQEGPALHYFQKSLELHPGDSPEYNSRQEIEEFIKYCRMALALPHFSENFQERTIKTWKVFEEKESVLRRLIHEDVQYTKRDRIVAMCEDILHITFDNISFELGFNGEKFDLILTPEGNRVKLFELLHFCKYVPKSVLEHWNILIGRQSSAHCGLKTDDWEISGDEVQVWIDQKKGNRIGLSVYCSKLSKESEAESNRVWWMLVTLTDQALGEISNMRYVESFDILDEPKQEPYILLSELREKLGSMGFDLSNDPGMVLESYINYNIEPIKDRDADWRLDIIKGSTNCAPVLNDYLSGKEYFIDELHADGAVAGFLCYPLEGFTGEDRDQQILDFKERLQDELKGTFGPDVLTLTGDATGLYCGYVDFIAWDLNTALGMARRFFKETDLPWASFHTFRRTAATVRVINKEAEALEKQKDESGTVSWTPDGEEEFYAQIEQWNSDDKYSLCINVLKKIPEEVRDYRASYALVRALENYAVLGDHNEEPEEKEAEQALQQALNILETIREEGKERAEWNMRMAYAYQYLKEYEKAIPYAQHWAELDPQDEDAREVIEECKVQAERKCRPGKSNEVESAAAHKGVFTGFVLLSDASWDKSMLIHDMKEKWDITIHESEGDKTDDTLIFDIGDMIIAVSLFKWPVPDREAEKNAENNYIWKEAVEAAKAHKAHIMVAVLGKEEDLIMRGKLFTKLLAACCRQPNTIGIYTSGVVFQPTFYEKFADMMKEDKLPIYNWIWFGLYRTENGISGYTYGMDVFGKEEMEVLNVQAEPSDVQDFLASLVFYVLERDATLQDGETIGFSAEDKHRITRSKGKALPDQMTLKISYEPLPEYMEDDTDAEMDDAAWHIESIIEKELPVEELAAYNHLAIYLRWCMEHDLMSDDFLAEYGDLVQTVKSDPWSVDLREFIRDKLLGQLFNTLFNPIGKSFANYYYGEGTPYFPQDIDSYAIEKIGAERNYSDEIQDEAYLFISFDEIYYQDMAGLMDKRFTNWQGQSIDEETKVPSALAQALMSYLDCECQYFPAMADDDPVMSAYRYAKRDGDHEGYIPVLIKVDETLWECLILNSDPDSDNADDYTFDADKVAEYRGKLLSTPVKDGRAVLEELIGQRKAEAEEDDRDWAAEVLGKMEGGGNNERFSGYWAYDGSNKTYPMILAKIPVKNPWEVFAYLPFGAWNDCPDTPELMAIAKYWFEQYHAVPAVITHDVLEFELPKPVPEDQAMKTAEEQYGFCPDIVDQGPENASVGWLADVLRKSTVWYFWWD